MKSANSESTKNLHQMNLDEMLQFIQDIEGNDCYYNPYLHDKDFNHDKIQKKNQMRLMS